MRWFTQQESDALKKSYSAGKALHRSPRVSPTNQVPLFAIEAGAVQLTNTSSGGTENLLLRSKRSLFVTDHGLRASSNPEEISPAKSTAKRSLHWIVALMTLKEAKINL